MVYVGSEKFLKSKFQQLDAACLLLKIKILVVNLSCMLLAVTVCITNNFE